jgi:Skp family chaperone for outer membrane proteins
VKRKIAGLTAIAALSTVVYLGTHRSAQGTPTTGASARPLKVAVFNLPLVIKKYKKYEVYEADLKAFVTKAQTTEERLRGDLLKLQQEGQAVGKSTDDLEERLKKKKRELEDVTTQLKKDFARKQDEQMVQLYQEIEDMVRRLAVSNGWSLVFQYGDVIEAKDKYNARIVQHKVLGGVCMPMYTAAGIDVSEEIIYWLNKPYTDKSTGRK